MKLKRGVWVAACLIGIAVFGGLAALLGAMTFWGVDEGGRASSGFIQWAVTFILIAAACGSALFLAPKDIDEATALEADDDPAQWVKDLRRDQNDPR
jgi:H+/Cl- antiporter ClcA